MTLKKLIITILLLLTTLSLTACSFGEMLDSLSERIAHTALEKRQQESNTGESTEETELQIRYLLSSVPLREEISISDSVEIAQLEAGEEVILLSEEGSWAKIRRADGMEGYVLASVLSEEPVKAVNPDDTHWEYAREGLEIEINKHKDGNLVYWVADVYTENPDEDINTAFAGGSYESCMKEKETVSEQVKGKNAIFAVNGDSVGFRPTDEEFRNPIVIRNGELCYEDNRDIGKMCALMKDGTLKIFSPGDLGSGKRMIERGVTDTWWFDTPLVEHGEVISSLYEVEESLDLAPYTAIGQKDKNNFIFIVVDGRGSNGSPGTTYTGMARFMVKYGAKTAYQLDGGGSSTIWFDGMVLNQPSDGYERPISDSIYISK